MEKTRKKLGATPMSVLQSKGNEVASKTGKGGRADYLKFDVGYNKFRIYPAHPGTESFMQACVVYYVPSEYDESNKRYSKKAVFNSKVHGNTEKDIIEEYIRYLTEVKMEGVTGNDLDEVLKPILGYMSEFNLEPQVKWVVYADKYSEDGKKINFGRVGFTNGTKVKMEGIIATESADEPIMLDPFTDEEDGVALIVRYNPSAKDKAGKKDAKNYYNVELEEKKTGKFKRELIPTPLTEKEIENFLKIESLQSLYKNVYGVRDFNIALSGLQIIDEECKYGVLDDPEFLEIVEEIKSYYPEDDEENQDNNEIEIDEIEDEIENNDESDDLDSLDRLQLKALILKEFGQGVIIIYKSYSDDDIRNLIREKRKETDVKVDEEESLEDQIENQEEENEPFEDGKEGNSVNVLRDAIKKRDSKKTTDKKTTKSTKK